MQSTPLSRSEASLIRGLHRRKVREEKGLFLAEGVRVVEDLLGAGIVLRQVVISPTLEDTPRGAALLSRLIARMDPRRVSDVQLAGLAATETPQGVVVVAEVPDATIPYLEDGPAAALVLDGVQDPGNLGTLVRSADAFGVAFVIALPGTVDAWNPKAVRASAGSSFRVPVIQSTPEAAADALRERGFRILAADSAGSAVDRIDLPGRIALVVGNEGGGVSERMRELADTEVAVPIRGGAESLNVAVAAGILLYLMTRAG
jgi:TrmH family RNA methyltransferase